MTTPCHFCHESVPAQHLCRALSGAEVILAVERHYPIRLIDPDATPTSF
jgi:hypothetical protein